MSSAKKARPRHRILNSGKNAENADKRRRRRSSRRVHPANDDDNGERKNSLTKHKSLPVRKSGLKDKIKRDKNMSANEAMGFARDKNMSIPDI